MDTLARYMPGEENSAQDMGKFIEGCDRLRVLTGACVLIVHHNNKAGGYRGSTALLGAVDTMIELERKGTFVTLACTKQKDGEEFSPIHLAARVVELTDDNGTPQLDQYGRVKTSIAMQPASAEAVAASKPLKDSEQTALAALERLGGCVTAADWERASGRAGSTFYRAIDALVKSGRVVKEGEGRGATYHEPVPF